MIEMITKFKIFENLTDEHIKIIDLIIDLLIEDYNNNNYTYLRELLYNIDEQFLIGCLPEDSWLKNKKDRYKTKNAIIDLVIEELKDDFYNEDYTVLDELLGFIPENELKKSIPKEKWENYLLKNNMNKYNL